MGEGPSRQPVRRALRRSLVALSSLALALVVAELAARWWLANAASDESLSRFGTFEEIERSRDLLLERHHYLPFVPKPGYRSGPNQHDSRGFRGEEVAVPKPPGVFRIVLVGGSTTYTQRVKDYRESFPYVLQRLLRERGHASVEVVNAGVNDYSTWETLLNLELRVLDLDPDLVGIYHGINDVHARLVWPHERYRGDNSGSRRPYGIACSCPSALEHVALGRIARGLLGLRSPDTGFASTSPEGGSNHAVEFAVQWAEGTYPSGIFREASAAEMLRANPPVYFERNLRACIGVCRAMGVGVFLATFKHSDAFPRDPRVASEEYVGAYAEQNAVVQRLAESTGTPCLDLARIMPDDRRYYVDGRHLTAEGAALKASLYADFLEESGLVPR